MIENSVKHDADTELFRLLGQREQLFFATPFRVFASLLVELSEVIKIVDVISSTFWVCTFASLGQITSMRQSSSLLSDRQSQIRYAGSPHGWNLNIDANARRHEYKVDGNCQRNRLMLPEETALVVPKPCSSQFRRDSQ